MFAQLIDLLTNHDCVLFSGFYLILILNSISFFSFSTTLVILIAGLVFYASKLIIWISNLTSKQPIVPYDWLDELAHHKVITLVNEKLDLSNITHCGQEISLENETFRISENICKDYIVPWCTTISPDSAFPADAERAIFELIHTILRKLSSTDVIEFSKDILDWFELICSPSNRDKINLNDEEMNIFLETCTEKVLKSCSASTLSLTEIKDKLYGNEFNDPLILMIKELLAKAAIIPIVDLISDPEFLTSCVARLFGIKIRDDALYELDGIQDFLQNNPDPFPNLLLKNLPDGTVRSISVDGNITNISELSQINSEANDKKFKLHKRSLSQPDLMANNQQRLMDSLSCETGIDLDSLPNPSSRVFRNIRINKWELVKNSREMYIVYIISVDALFEEVHPEKMFPPSPVENLTSATEEEETREECVASSLIWKNLTIKHRFREFVDLQTKLENNARLRGTLRGMHKTVIKPSTLKVTMANIMSFNPLRSNVSNRSVVEHRRRCLEKYLNELSKFERISRSREFRDFLGYREERSSFLRSPSQSILVPLGIDRVYRNVRDAITFLKPSNPTEGTFAPGPSLVISDSPLTCLKLTKLSHTKQSKILKTISEPRFISNLIQSNESNRKEIASGETSPEICFFHLSKRSQGSDRFDGSPVDSQRKHKQSVKIPLIDSLINIIQSIIPVTSTSWVSLSLLTTKIYLGATLERIIGSLISRICCTETFVYLLHTLHESIWEDEDNEDWIRYEVQSTSHLIYKLVKMLHCKPLINHLPLQFVEKSVQSVFNTFQSKDHNKMFIILVLSSLLKRSQI
ncbi:uncharacterized protein LOC128385836 isoform X2 [Panonychus citri]|uniref:uncharacterized protein LOC128385836 isoform X2 n=1 Tax=Panonychus citri TaxID=50023 RepID=UPI0023080D1B|nr:uncharacterized protein LOC128385836 isoform X2 [Panonychus citri]